ncbi:MAG: GNAT family N-acetyltransferase [Promethearchaeota archaeon]|jgi:ribosomal-protein-alanine N-acetyltransferase
MIFDAEVVEEINDENLYLRKVKKSDAEFFLSSLNEVKLTSYLSLGPLKTIENSKRLLRNYLKYWERYAQYNYVIEIRNSEVHKIGSSSLWNVNWRHNRAEVGIWILPSYWNRKLGEKALTLIKIIAFNHLKLNRLEAHIAIENKNSIQLFKKCDFKEEGVLKQYLNFKEAFHDALVLACLKSDDSRE